MKTLAIDTSLASGSVAAIDSQAGPPLLAERRLGLLGEHARCLATALVEVAADLGWTLRDAELIAVVRGPGSFTGLRVGVTAAKAMAWATGARLIGVSGFEIVARQTAHALGGAPTPIAVAFDAGRGDVCAALVVPDPGSPTQWRVEPSELLSATAWLDSQPPGALLSGPAIELLAESLAMRNVSLAPPAARFPSAAGAAAIAELRAAAGEADDPHTLVPDYSRPSYAEEKPLGSSG